MSQDNFVTTDHTYRSQHAQLVMHHFGQKVMLFTRHDEHKIAEVPGVDT